MIYLHIVYYILLMSFEHRTDSAPSTQSQTAESFSIPENATPEEITQHTVDYLVKQLKVNEEDAKRYVEDHVKIALENLRQQNQEDKMAVYMQSFVARESLKSDIQK